MLVMADVCADHPKPASGFIASVYYGGWCDAGEVLYFCPVWSHFGRLCHLRLYLPLVLSILEQLTERRLGQHITGERLSIE